MVSTKILFNINQNPEELSTILYYVETISFSVNL